MSDRHNLPEGWVAKESKSRPGVVYYYNQDTQVTQWEVPTASEGTSNGKVRASHLLVKHSGSRRPSSWREEVITRSESEARALIDQYRKEIADSSDQEQKFGELASKYSDCSSASKRGDLGSFGRGQMQKSFEDAAFALTVGDISGPVKSDSGIHIILRTA
ncbi:peptidyl-prolyl cis-trans isomerase [Acrasis kona]|uniref:Peptidyl-prolyl cis-trans isomerase n=1 Tax=Acrasis kona TaxID=1008807 RepID=A0AAW2ZKZ7_9EUKA